MADHAKTRRSERFDREAKQGPPRVNRSHAHPPGKIQSNADVAEKKFRARKSQDQRQHASGTGRAASTSISHGRGGAGGRGQGKFTKRPNNPRAHSSASTAGAAQSRRGLGPAKGPSKGPAKGPSKGPTKGATFGITIEEAKQAYDSIKTLDTKIKDIASETESFKSVVSELKTNPPTTLAAFVPLFAKVHSPSHVALCDCAPYPGMCVSFSY